MKNYKLKKYINFFESIYKSGKTIVKFGDIEIEKKKISQHERTISIKKNIDINKIVVSNKVSFVKKSFKSLIGYKYAKIRPLCIFLPKMGTYRKDFHETKYFIFDKK